MPLKHELGCETLRQLIGQQVLYHQQPCEIIELLDGCQLVLQVLDRQSSIQANQFGEGHRSVPTTYTVPIFDAAGDLNQELHSAGLDRLLTQ